MGHRSLMAIAALALVTAGCGDDERVCDPGATQKCYCAGGIAGYQTCHTAGSGWGTCSGCTAKQDGSVDMGADAAGPDIAPGKDDAGKPDAAPCGPGTKWCNGKCADLQKDVDNCGACGTKCKAGQVCSKGTCSVSCQTGLTNCYGSCVNLETDVFNCGACGSTCKTGQI